MTLEGGTHDADQQKWWTLLRRSFDIPDIVSTGNQAGAVAHALLERRFPPPARPEPPKPFPQNIAEEDTARAQVKDSVAVVQAIVRMGANGELDELFVAVGPNRADNVTRSARVKRAISDLETGSLVDEVFKAVTDHVITHSFDDTANPPSIR